jgi:hypothetical protein
MAKISITNFCLENATPFYCIIFQNLINILNKVQFEKVWFSNLDPKIWDTLIFLIPKMKVQLVNFRNASLWLSQTHFKRECELEHSYIHFMFQSFVD